MLAVGGSRLSLKSLLLWSWVHRVALHFVCGLAFLVSAFPLVLVSYFHQPIWGPPSWMLSWPHENSSLWCFRWYCLSYSLSQSHSRVLKEQYVFYNDNSRLGDVYHPDFQFGRVAYFDESVCSTTQPSYISSSSCCAGVAAAASEVAKDLKHQDLVKEAGCDFVPFVMETFRVWSPFALCTLHTIADHTTARSGVFTKAARKHLLQQLSVSLWTNNAQMILQYWALQCEDTDIPFPHLTA